MNTYGFIGCGNMGGILAANCARIFGKRTLLCDLDTEKTKKIADETGAQTATLEEIARNCYYIVIGVKPQAIASLLKELAPILSERKDRFALISIAAGVSTETFCQHVGSIPVIRIMPNTPAAVNEGMILCCYNDKIDPETDLDDLPSVLSAGKLDFIKEEMIDAASALSGCGPAFVYMFIEALADGAVKCGLPRDKALYYASQTVLGAGKMVLQSGMHPGQLKDAVCSPGGSTIAGVAALENSAFRSAAINAVEAAYNRTKELG